MLILFQLGKKMSTNGTFDFVYHFTVFRVFCNYFSKQETVNRKLYTMEIREHNLIFIDSGNRIQITIK